MTQMDDKISVRPAFRPRTELDVVAQQLVALEQFLDVRRSAETEVAGVVSREARLDLDRQRDVLRREHEAVVARLDEQLQRAGQPLDLASPRRVVLAHRNQWFLDKVAAVLLAAGIEIVATTDNGADAVGTALAEQPDLVLVEESLGMLTGEQVVREVRHFSPDTLVVAQVAYSDRVGAVLDAGAAAVFTRQIPPADVAQRLLELLALE